MNITTENDLIVAHFEFNKEKIAIVKAAGMRWSTPRHHWSMPNTIENQLRLKRVLEPDKPSSYQDYIPSEYLMSHQRTGVEIAKTRPRHLFAYDTGCHAAGTEILMADGTIKNVETIAVGDFVLGYDGTPMEVSRLYSGIDSMYRITPVKGASFDVNKDHILTLMTTPKVKGDHKEMIDIPLSAYLLKANRWKHCRKLVRSGAINFPHAVLADLPIDPYFLGLYLGDGHSHAAAITTMDQEVVDELYKQAKNMDLQVRVINIPNNKANSYYFKKPHNGHSLNALESKLKNLGLMISCETKHIPQAYKTASIQERLEVLAGLLDSDGSITGANCYEYTSKSGQLIKDILFVARSLGLAAYYNVKPVNGVNYYRACISGNTDKIPCRIPHKKASARQQLKDALVTGFTVESLGAGEYYGFEIGGHHRYLLSDFTITHNTGKTALSIEVIKMKRLKTLVVCPLAIIQAAWFEDLNKFAPELSKSNLWQLWRGTKAGNMSNYLDGLKADICIINFEGFKAQQELLKKSGFRMVIVDESSKIKSTKAQVTKDITKFCQNVDSVYLLSGTPAPNSLMEYYTQIRVIDPMLLGTSWYRFRANYFYEAGFKWHPFPEKVPELLNKIASASTAVRKEDVLDLPERTFNVRDVSLSPAETSAYNEMLKNMILAIANNETITAANAAVKIMKLRQVTAGFMIDEEGGVHEFGHSKENALADLLEEIGPKHQVIIWTQFQYEARQIKKLLGDKAEIVNGTVSQADKEIYVERFKAGKLPYLIAHPRSLGHGVTLTNCSYAIYYSIDYSYEAYYQSCDRIYRYGQKNACSYYHLLCPGTIDVVVHKALGKKGTMERAVVDYIRRGGEL